MAEHQLRPLWGGSPAPQEAGHGGRSSRLEGHDWPLASLLEAAAAGSGSAGRPARRPQPVPLPRRFFGCPAHPEEPLQYFCLKCQSHCICAECVINGEHRGHDVLNVREAARRLPDRAAELAASARLRAEEVSAVAGKLREGRRELAAVTERGRKDLHAATERLALALRGEEEAMLNEVDRCASDLWEMLQTDQEALLGEALRELAVHREAGDTANALIWFARLRKAVAAPLGSQPDSDRLATQLRGQLQRGFDGRLAGLAALATCLAEIRETKAPSVAATKAPSIVAAAEAGFYKGAA